MSNQSMSFEASMERLSQIVSQLEGGSVPLADALKLFQEGTGLVERCTKLLDQAELEIVKLTKTPEGTMEEVPFANEDTQ